MSKKQRTGHDAAQELPKTTSPLTLGGATASRRAERILSRFGLFMMSLMFLALLLLTDVALTGHKPPGSARPDLKEFDINLVARDGRDIGGTRAGMPLSLSPGVFYENRPLKTATATEINSCGLRGPEIEELPRRPRIIVVGGSAAFGLGVAAGQTFVAALQEQHPEWEVLNAGTVGYLSVQELGLVVFKLSDLRPDLVIAFNGWNDLYDHYWWSFARDRESPHPGVNANFAFMEDRLVNYRRVQTNPWYALGEAAATIVRSSTILGAAASWRPAIHVRGRNPQIDSQEMTQIVKHYVNNMTKLRDLLASRKGRLLVVVQPEVGQVLTESDMSRLLGGKRDLCPNDHYFDFFPGLYREFRRQVMRSLAERGIPAIDCSASISSGANGSELFRDPVHLNPKGHQVVAQVISSRLGQIMTSK